MATQRRRTSATVGGPGGYLVGAAASTTDLVSVSLQIPADVPAGTTYYGNLKGHQSQGAAANTITAELRPGSALGNVASVAAGAAAQTARGLKAEGWLQIRSVDANGVATVTSGVELGLSGVAPVIAPSGAGAGTPYTVQLPATLEWRLRASSNNANQVTAITFADIEERRPKA